MCGGQCRAARLLPLILVVVLGGVAPGVLAAPRGIPAPTALLLHPPIWIQGNAGFTAANGVVGGSGTPSDPYVISGWTITSLSSDGIVIWDTNASFILRDMALTNGTPFHDALAFRNVSHGAVENVTFENGWSGGAMLNTVSEVRLANSSFVGIGSNVDLDHSSGVAILGNTFTSGGSTVGISVNETTDTVLQGNRVAGAFIGIAIGYNSRVEIIGNNITESTLGIGLYDSAGTVQDNDLGHNGDGLFLGGSSNVTVTENRVRSSTGTGIMLTASTGIRVYHNSLDSNAVQASDDTASQNTWNDGYPSGGNFWSNYTGVDRCSGPLQDHCTASDGIGDTPIAFASNAQDRYPLMFPDTPPPPVSFTLYGSATAGWGESPSTVTIPGPTLHVTRGVPVILSLTSVDGLDHDWYLDSNNDSVPSPGEPVSPGFNGTSPLDFSFTPTVAGVFTYRCAIHPATMWGRMVVNQTYPDTALLLDGRSGIAGWYTSWVNVTLTVVDTRPGPWITFYRIDGSEWAESEGTFTLDRAGVTFLEFFSAGSTGRAEPVRNTTIPIDLDGPQVTLSAYGTLGENGWYVSPATVAVTSVGSVAPPVTLACTADGVSLNPCVPVVFTTDGRHTFAVNATDAAGLEASLLQVVNVDQTPPVSDVATLDGTQGNAGWWVTGVDVAVGAGDVGSGLQNTSWRVDGGPWYVLTDPGYVVITEGIHVFEYYSTDRAGNIEPSHALTLHVDTHAPQLDASILGTPGADGWIRGPATVQLNATDLVSGVASLAYGVDGDVDFHAFTAPFSLADGVHRVAYYAADVAGNVAWANATVRVDSLPPAVDLEGWTSVMNSRTVALHWTGSDAVSGVLGYRLSVDGGPWAPVTANITLTLADGPHTIRLRAEDVAGNNVTVTAQFRIDTAALSLTGPYGPWAVVSLLAGGFAVGLAATFLWMRRRKPGA